MTGHDRQLLGVAAAMALAAGSMLTPIQASAKIIIQRRGTQRQYHYLNAKAEKRKAQRVAEMQARKAAKRAPTSPRGTE